MLDRTKEIKIIHCGKTEKHEWNKYVENHEYGNFYLLYEWKEINENNFGHATFFLAAQKANKIVGIFPLVYINSKIFGKILASMPFVNFGGLIADSIPIEHALLDEAKDIALSIRADFIEIRSNRNIAEDLPTSSHKISMNIDLLDDPNILWNNFKSKHRNNIRRVYKKGITVESGGMELLDYFYDILCESWKNLGTPIYRISYFEDILIRFGSAVRIFIATLNNKPIAAAFNGYFKGTVEGMWAGNTDEARALQANYVLYWEMIKHACESHQKKFHLGRSSIGSNAEIYKKKWNAIPIPLYWQYYLNNRADIPQINVNNPNYKMAIKVWRKSPMFLTDLVGPYLAKNIP